MPLHTIKRLITGLPRQKQMMVLSLLTIISSLYYFSAVAYDIFDPTANITITWDVIAWTPDGYVAVVKINNYQMYRQIASPGWTLGWTWSKKEVIWSIVGAEATDQGDCKELGMSDFHVPHSCDKHPRIMDMQPGAAYNNQFQNCCKAGILSSLGQDPANSVSAFQLSVGNSGNRYTTLSLPKNFSLLGPKQGYTCSSLSQLVPPSVISLSSAGHRKNRALMSWQSVCSYSQLLATKTPTCCVSMSSFYNAHITPCPSCACGCMKDENCALSVGQIEGATATPVKQCSEHMCPIRVHWHVKKNYKGHWLVRIAITNLYYNFNYTKWTLVAQHPNLNNVVQVDHFTYKPLIVYGSINDTGMFYGEEKLENEILLEAGSVYAEMILKKDRNMFTLSHGWAFPRKVYFNGDECMMPFAGFLPLSSKFIGASCFIYRSTYCNSSCGSNSLSIYLPNRIFIWYLNFGKNLSL